MQTKQLCKFARIMPAEKIFTCVRVQSDQTEFGCCTGRTEQCKSTTGNRHSSSKSVKCTNSLETAQLIPICEARTKHSAEAITSSTSLIDGRPHAHRQPTKSRNVNFLRESSNNHQTSSPAQSLAAACRAQEDAYARTVASS